MRKPILTALIAGALSAAPIVAFGQTSTAKAPAAKQSSTTSTSSASQPAAKSESTTHSTRGVVKSINDSTLVITRSSKKNPGDMTLALNSSTHRDGTIAVGTPVSVRYTHEGKTYTAMAITAQQAKAPAKPSASSTSTAAPKK